MVYCIICNCVIWQVVQFIAFLSKFPTGESKSDTGMVKAFEVEITKFLNLLINNMDFKADNAVNCLKEFRDLTLPRKYRIVAMDAVRLCDAI